MSDPITQMRYCMNTLFEIRVWTSDEDEGFEAIGNAFELIEEFQNLFSRFDPDSEVSQLNKEADNHPIEVSDELFDILLLSQKISRDTDGAFDITAGKWSQLWEQAEKAQHILTDEDLAAFKKHVGWEKIQLDATEQTVYFTAKDLQIDLGGIGKGYAVDKAVDLLKAAGIERGIVDAGGNFKVFGFDPLPEIAIEESDGSTTPLQMTKAAVATSNQTLRYFEIQDKRFGHIIDPQTGLPLETLEGQTVFSSSAAKADALSTAALFNTSKKVQL